MDLEQSFKNLKQSPMFAISLSSKELFHSNFWAWLIEYNPEYSKVFFDDIDFNNKLFVKREEKNRDLSIHLNQWMGLYYRKQIEIITKSRTNRRISKKRTIFL